MAGGITDDMLPVPGERKLIEPVERRALRVTVPAAPLLLPKTAVSVEPVVSAFQTKSVEPSLQSASGEVSHVPVPSAGSVGLAPLASQVRVLECAARRKPSDPVTTATAV